MSLAQTRSIMVDDLDVNIQYTGSSWFAYPAYDTPGIFGSPLFNTLHGTNDNASLTFSFSGTKVLVAGALPDRATPPTWRCFIDGEEIQTKNFPYSTYRWPICENDYLLDGQHTISVNATVSPGQTFWLDYIQYAPSVTVPLENAAVYIDSTDKQMVYGTGWSPIDSGMETNQARATFTLDFYGTSLTWFGITPNTSVSLKNANGTYSVDGQAPVTFQLVAPPVGQPLLHNQIFLQTPMLTSGPHQLIVTYLGNSGSTPLTIDDVIVQNASSATSSVETVTIVSTDGPTTTGIMQLANGTSIGLKSRHKTINIGAIVGGGLGAFALVLSVGLCILYNRRSRARQHSRHEREPPFDVNALTRFATPMGSSDRPIISGPMPVQYPPLSQGSHSRLSSQRTLTESVITEHDNGWKGPSGYL